MAEATFENVMSDYAESSTAATAATSTVLSRNDDPLTVALRSKTEHPPSLAELVDLTRAGAPSRSLPSTLGTLTTTAFSSQKESSVTKPTSAGTSYVVDGYTGKGKSKVVKTYASSMSATHGSGSEAEADQDNALAGVGDQFEVNTLRGSRKPRKRPVAHRLKRIPPMIHYDTPPLMSSEEEMVRIEEPSSRHGKEPKYFRLRKSKKSDESLVIADEERISPGNEHKHAPRFSRARLNVVIGLCVFIVLTFALSAFAAHHTGKGRLACTKGIIFSATILISFSTVLVMVLARRPLQEALLAGLLEVVIGFALVTEIRDFMEHIP